MRGGQAERQAERLTEAQRRLLKEGRKYNGARCSDRPDIYGGSAYGQLKRTRRTKLGTYTLFAGIVFLALATLTTLATTIYADHPWLAGLTR